MQYRRANSYLAEYRTKNEEIPKITFNYEYRIYQKDGGFKFDAVAPKNENHTKAYNKKAFSRSDVQVLYHQKVENFSSILLHALCGKQWSVDRLRHRFPKCSVRSPRTPREKPRGFASISY